MSRHKGDGAEADVDRFNVAARTELTAETVGARPGNVLVPVSNYNALYHLAGGARSREDRAPRHRGAARPAPAPRCLGPDRFRSGSAVWQHRTVSLYQVAGARRTARQDPFALRWFRQMTCGTASCAPAVNLESSTIVLGRSSKMSVAEQAREFGMAWEKLPDPRPQFNLEIFAPGGQREFFLLGPHSPNLTMNEVNLVHQLWLRLSDLVRARGIASPRRGSLRAQGSAAKPRERPGPEARRTPPRTPKREPDQTPPTALVSSWLSYLSSRHFLQTSIRPMRSCRPAAVVTHGRISHGGRCLTCCVWPQERSATQSPDSSW